MEQRFDEGECTVDHLSQEFKVKVPCLHEKNSTVVLNPLGGKFSVTPDQTYYLFKDGKLLLCHPQLPVLLLSSSPLP